MIIPDIYVNAGGVVVSYFEWVKDISHIRFKKTNTKTDFDTIKKIIHGADEEDLAFSGLEDSMRNAFIEIYNAKKQIKKSFRDSAYYVSLKKIRNFYTVEGFPKR